MSVKMTNIEADRAFISFFRRCFCPGMGLINGFMYGCTPLVGVIRMHAVWMDRVCADENLFIHTLTHIHTLSHTYNLTCAHTHT